MNKLEIILTRGLPGSGKTTWANNKVSTSNGTYININKDDIRTELGLDYSEESEKKVKFERDKRTRQALEQGTSVIWSDTNLLGRYKQKAQIIAWEFNAELIIEDSFLKVPLEECIKRDAQRSRSIGEQRIGEMWNLYQNQRYKAIQGFN